MNWGSVLFVAFVGACLFKFRNSLIRFRGASSEESARQKAQEKLSGYRFLQEFTLILPDGKRISFAETESEVEI